MAQSFLVYLKHDRNAEKYFKICDDVLENPGQKS